MSNSWLLKFGKDFSNGSSFDVPKRAKPKIDPQQGDRIFFWENGAGLTCEALVTGNHRGQVSYNNVARYSDVIPDAWLNEANREKRTIRSKLHCDRNNRLWHLSEDDVMELDNARRFGWQIEQ